jgi:hypothetical protein
LVKAAAFEKEPGAAGQETANGAVAAFEFALFKRFGCNALEFFKNPFALVTFVFVRGHSNQILSKPCRALLMTN